MLFLSFLASACAADPLERFKGEPQTFVLEEYFEGRSTAWGIFEDRFGTLRRQFRVELLGEWDGETLTLTEDFFYDDGQTDQRVWRFTKVDDVRYTATASDVSDPVEVTLAGSAAAMAYVVPLKVGGDAINVHFSDLLIRHSEDVLFNRAIVSKFGVEIGRVSITFERQAVVATLREAA